MKDEVDTDQVETFEDEPSLFVDRGEAKPNMLKKKSTVLFERGILKNNPSMYKYSFPGAKKTSFKNLSKVNFGEPSSNDLRQSTIDGMMKDQVRLKSMASFGHGGIMRLRGDSTTPMPASGKNPEHSLPSLLCLHGWRSNSDISRFHLESLGIMENFNTVYLSGPIQSNKPANTAVGILTPGPYYSWADQDQTDDRDCDIENIIESLKSLMLHLLLVPESREEACYDAVFAFSQAVPLISLLSYESVRNRVLKDMGIKSSMKRLPWRFVIAACGANVRMIKRVFDHYKLPSENLVIPLPSVHIVGTQDQFKTQSEEMMCLFPSKDTIVFYLDCGHEIPALTRRIEYLPREIIGWFTENVKYFKALDIEVGIWADSTLSMIETSYDMHDFISSPIHPKEEHVGTLEFGTSRQYALNHIKTTQSSLLEMLKDASPASPALYSPGMPPLTYGGLLKFIYGEGDMRRIGANHNFTVAYVAPLGVISAVAFLAISCQCTAAPLDPAYTVEALLLAFEQLNPDIVISFDGVDTTNLMKAASKSNVKTVHAKSIPDTCGLYTFGEGFNASTFIYPKLENPSDNIALILRTSGTTSAPKICALQMSSIVSNSRIIAKNLGLNSNDVALNAMPLFHIGGLSANLLSSLAAGASVVLLPRFDVEQFFQALISNTGTSLRKFGIRINDFPEPTWFSAVPTMHAAIQQYAETTEIQWKTSLRFIRTGAAAMPADLALRMEKTFGCPLILTYSMTEQMPISQPPTLYSIPQKKPNSVGQPVAASLCVVDNRLRPLPFSSENDQNGEICISGPTVLSGYYANPSANGAAYFYLGGMKWFRTGDVGHLDKDGFLFLTGRNKELIKRGGEQVSPYEVEDACYNYEAVETCIVFAVPSTVWGEQVGAAIVLYEDYKKNNESAVRKQLYQVLGQSGLERHKYPEILMIIEKKKLLKTRSNKYIRIGLAEHLGLLNGIEGKKSMLKDMKSVSISDAAVGVRFILALAVMYVHVGKFSDEGYLKNDRAAWAHTRSWCFHTPIFFMVGGFFLAAGTHSPVTKGKDLWNFYSLRIASLHPMYLVSILLCLVNFLSRCRPSNYIGEFERIQVPINEDEFVCQATPLEMPWYLTLFTTLVTYGFALQSWPFSIPLSWFLSSYTWFSSVYIFCIAVFPWCHKQFYQVKDDIRKLWRLSVLWFALLYLYIGIFSTTFVVMFYDNVSLQNYWTLGTYLLPIGWVPCFALGIALYYLFRHYHPGEKKSAWIWGLITDFLSFCLLAGWLSYGLLPPKNTLPSNVNNALDNRFFAAYLSRVLCPTGFLWFWGMAVGKGFTAWIFSQQIFVSWLAPASYNMFLFHQSISELYYFITRGKWWAKPKNFYWFSPYPIPVEAWEFPIVILIIIIFSILMEVYVNEWLIRTFSWMMGSICVGDKKIEIVEGDTTDSIIISILSKLTYSDMITKETTLSEAGLSSMTTIMLVGELKKHYGGLRISARDCSGAVTVKELAELIEERMKESKYRPELALMNRTSIFLQPDSQQTQETKDLKRQSVVKVGGMKGSIAVS